MKCRLSMNTICLYTLSVMGFQGFFYTAGAQSMHAENSATAVTIDKPVVSFPAGRFDGDDIRVKLDNQDKYLLSGGAVDKPEQGTWTTEKKGKHTLIRLISNNKKDDDWLFGVRTKNILQMVDEDKLNVLDKPLNIAEDVGILTREK